MHQLGELKELKHTKSYDLEKDLARALSAFEKAETSSEIQDNFQLYNEETFETIKLFDEILEVVDNFGKSNLDNDSDEEEEDKDVQEEDSNVPESIQNIRESDEFNQWWRDHVIKFYKVLQKQDKKPEKLYKTVCFNLGQSYLKEAEEPANIFTTLKYDDSFTDSEINGLDEATAQAIGIELFQTAINYLRQSWDDEDVSTWVNLSESLISLGNLHELESEDQTKCYAEAEKILVRANNVTNGKYKDILDNLLEE
ncbi:hypothetical protein CANTEDRAFT_116399 [Yamadazyma tenuis ATCC 10573]|nr:uncharacterized protein CANTEDRAFT_116399 [Yamadazyma tenuis ATCC 10573]EGV61103.1 hypothetical protein CANTEDRAFT_116399 [Yamadazyma tenuis ATCC 10573]